MNSNKNLSISLYNFNKFLVSYFLPGIITLILFLFTFDLIFTKFILLKTDTTGYSKIHRLINYQGEEIPIMGASRANSSYVPDPFGSSTYNYGLQEASFLSTSALLNIELKKKKKSPIIIDFTYWYWNTIGDIADYIPFANHSDINELLKQVGLYKTIYTIPGLRYFGFYDYYTKEYLNQFIKFNKIVIRGFSHPTSPQIFNAKRFKELISKRLASPVTASIDKKQNEMLINHITSHPERHFYLTISPFHSSFLQSLKKLDELDDFYSYLDSFPNVTFIDYSSVNYPDSLFFDTSHLNYNGALEFSKELSLKISKTKEGIH